MSVAQGSRLSSRRKIIIEKHMDRYYSFLLSSFCGVYLRRGEVGGGVCGTSQGLQMGKTRQKNIHRRNFTSISTKLRRILIIIISGHYKPFVFKICQTVAGITMMRQFHDFFFIIFFWRVFPNLVQLCA